MARKLIVCCDGTGNEIKENQSNVLKLYRLLEKNSSQLAFYDPGVGTIGDSSAWDKAKNKARGIFGLVTGYGLDQNVLEAYTFLIRNYQEGDDIYLFGFSRGAYTVRVLAGLINMIGLLAPNNENLCGYALTAYKQASAKDNFAIAWRFQDVLQAKNVTIRFMGCWDTVGSVIVPRPDRWYIAPSLLHLPYTRSNPCVQVFRHAMAIDEKRRMFRLMDWDNNQQFKSNPFVKVDVAANQDCRQVWFSGVHADIGGGYPESESSAAKIPLKWMLDEARDHGLIFRKTMVSRLVDGNNPPNSPHRYTAPNPNADLHDSMNWAWRLLEWIPKCSKCKEWPDRRSFFGFYLPQGEPRKISIDAEIDSSVYRRTQYSGIQPYSPPNVMMEKN